MGRWLLLLTAACGASACTYIFDSPERTMRRAAAAFEAKDVTTFEQLVDLESVSRDATVGCMAMAKLDTYVEDQFAPTNEWTALGENFADGLLSVFGGAMAEGLAATARGDFGNQSPDEMGKACGGLKLGDIAATTFETAGATSRASIPVTLRGGTASTVRVRLGDDPERGWRVVGVEFNSTLDAYATEQKQVAETQARTLRATVETTLDGPAFRRLFAYSRSHGADAELATFVAQRAQAFMEAPSPVVPIEARLRRGRWYDDRAVATVRNDGAQNADKVFVTFVFFDRRGDIVSSRFDRFLLGQADANLPPGGSDTYTWDVNSFSWPISSIASARAFVVRIEWRDGTQWVHPGAAAGLFE